MGDFILELKDIIKTFEGVTALKGARFQLRRGEVHALMGENGAGKSTLIKIITGIHQPDSGTILLDGTAVTLHGPLDSQRLGIAAIYQHVTSFPDLSVTENIFMENELLLKTRFYNWREMSARARELLHSLGSAVDPSVTMRTLSVAQQQLVEIAKALSRDARILIMDEPTASLTKHECEELYTLVENLRGKGVSIIFISHRFEDMYRLADRVTVFRDAGYIGTWDVNQISNADLVKAMVGRSLDQMYPSKSARIGETVLKIENLSKQGYFKDISFDVRKGEIVALTGLVGAGRTEVCQTLFGIMKPDGGRIFLEGKEARPASPTRALRLGIGLLPEDRQLQGLVMELPIFQNVTAARLKKYVNRFFMDVHAEMDTAVGLCGRLALKAKNIKQAPSSLSGGNQQKVVAAKLLDCDLKVLILDEPTKGVDVGAKYSIYEIINELAKTGYAIIIVSSEMPEVLGMADRIVVMKSGRVTALFNAGEATQEKIFEASVFQSGSAGAERAKNG
ncbi:MAG: sugar ABC transporter ATP-binding protein [Treponema sp.]|nr:sugar ABC transporter ATP-binding protein [Treponema sp.]